MPKQIEQQYIKFIQIKMVAIKKYYEFETRAQVPNPWRASNFKQHTVIDSWIRVVFYLPFC